MEGTTNLNLTEQSEGQMETRVKPRAYTQEEADNRVKEVVDYMAAKYKKEFGNQIWSNLHLTIFIIASIIIGFITGYCVAPYNY